MQYDITGLTADQLRSLLMLAETVAKEAGMQLREAAKRGTWSAITEENRRDIKLEADTKSENHIIGRLITRSPYGVLGEEGGQQGPSFDADKDVFWIVDPLDGTVNYLQGVPLCCCSIALMKGNLPLLGVIYDFNNDELFSGIVGQGSFLNGEKIHVSKTARKQQAILMTGLPAGGSFSVQDMESFGRELSHWRKVRMIGSAALSIAFVACGKADAYWEQGIFLWDVAAGLALINAAGGSCKVQSVSRVQNANDPLARWRINVIATNGIGGDGLGPDLS